MGRYGTGIEYHGVAGRQPERHDRRGEHQRPRYQQLCAQRPQPRRFEQLGPLHDDRKLNVDKAAPAVSVVTANPNPSNGLISGNSAQPAVQVDATFADAGPSLAASIDGVTDGTSSGTYGTPSGIDPSMPVRAFIPLWRLTRTTKSS